MLPIAIFRFSPTEGPGHFADWLDGRGFASTLIAVERAADVPADPRRFAGIAMMGGPMSAYDPLPWIDPLSRLLREAVGAGVPVIGHCLGGQLLAQALGATVARAPVPEIGWTELHADDEDAASEWFGGRRAFEAFEWHYDAFALPLGARRVLANRANENQAFVVDDRHIGMQCHVEMTRPLVECWLASDAEALPPDSTGSLQSAHDIRLDLDVRLAALNALAGDVYARWARNLSRAG